MELRLLFIRYCSPPTLQQSLYVLVIESFGFAGAVSNFVSKQKQLLRRNRWCLYRALHFDPDSMMHQRGRSCNHHGIHEPTRHNPSSGTSCNLIQCFDTQIREVGQCHSRWTGHIPESRSQNSLQDNN
mmetsp:Transcript_18927/g.36813  ORF Transcript_18927/g.36813 Transcript_18927/m.36813 type:complete len:128 (-) Transcript_18927:708-1091(-)